MIDQISGRTALILAGGTAKRFGGIDKATLELAGKRLIDHVIERLRPQVDQIFISGNTSYDTGLSHLPDHEDGPKGPAAGLWAMASFAKTQSPLIDGFLAVPVDGPFLVPTLFADLYHATATRLCVSDDGLHPTFGYWQCADLLSELWSKSGEGVSLHAVAELTNAKQVHCKGAQSLFNINTPQDLTRATQLLRA